MVPVLVFNLIGQFPLLSNCCLVGMSRNTDGYCFNGHKLNKNLQSSNNIEIKENIIGHFEKAIGFSKNWNYSLVWLFKDIKLYLSSYFRG